MATELLLPLLLVLLPLAAPVAGIPVTNRNVMALHYNVTLAPFIYSGNASRHFLTGSVSISIRVLRTTYGFGMYVREGLRGKPTLTHEGRKQRFAWGYYVPTKSYQKMAYSEPLHRGAELLLHVPLFRGKLQSVQYLDAGGATKFAATSLQLSTFDFVPCLFDESVKVTMDVSIVRRSDFSAATNSESFSNRTEDNATSWWPEVDASEISGFSWTRETFATTEPMPVSHLQFVVSQMTQVAAVTDSKGRQHRFWSSPAASQMLRRLSGETMKLQEWLETKLTINYPKVDYFLMLSSNVSTYQARGSIGIVTMGWNSTLATSDSQFEVEHRLYELSRELAAPRLHRMWQLAEIFGYLALTSVHPKWRTDSWMLSDFRPRWWPKKNYNIKFTDQAKLMQLRYIVGPGSFDSWLLAVISQGWYGKGPTKLMYFATMLGGEQVANMYEKWFDGVPLVDCTVSADQLTLRQRNLVGKMRSSGWYLPITMVTSDNVTSLGKRRWYGEEWWEAGFQWLTQKRQSFSSFNTRQPPSWYLLNLRGAGLYRVNYDADNWAALGRLLRDNHELLHPLERAMLLEDSFELARFGMLNYSVPTNILRYVVKEKHPMLLHKLFGFFKYFCDMPDVWPPVRASACQLQASESFSSAPAKPRVPKAGGQQLGCPSLLENDSPESDDASWMEKVTAGYRRDILLQLRSRCVSNYA